MRSDSHRVGSPSESRDRRPRLLISYQFKKKKKNTDLKVQNDFARQRAHEPRLRDVPHHGRRQADQDHQEVGHRQVDDEIVGHRPHGPISATHARTVMSTRFPSTIPKRP